MPSARLLTQEQVLEIRAAVISAGLIEGRTALLSGIDAAFVASFPHSTAPGQQVLTDLDTLNAAGALADGTVPLKVWLRNALALAEPRREAEILRRFLRSLHETGAGGGLTLDFRREHLEAASSTNGTSHQSRGRPHALDPMYINVRRIAAIAGADANFDRAGYHSEKQAAYYFCVAHAQLLKRWLDRDGAEVASFEEDWEQARLVGGRIFTVHRWFRFQNARGLRKKGGAPLAYTTFSGRGRDGADLRLELRIEPSHIVEGSPGDLMTGTVSDVFVCAMTFEAGPSHVTAVPLFIGHKVTTGSWAQVLPAPRR